MNTLDDLRTALDAYADRDDARGADSILAAATAAAPTAHLGIETAPTPSSSTRSSATHARPSATCPSATRIDPGPANGSITAGAPSPTGARRRRFVLAAAAAVVAIVIGTTAVVRSSDLTQVVTAPSADVPRSLPDTIVVPSGFVDAVLVDTDRVWVATLDERTGDLRSSVRSFDVATGELRSEVQVVGASSEMGRSDHAVWLRTSTGGPASFPVGTGGEGDNAIYRIDPSSGEATPVRYLHGDGPMATTDDRVAVAGAVDLEVFDERGTDLATTTVDAALGAPDGTAPGSFRSSDLAFAAGDAPTILYVVSADIGAVTSIDATTGDHQVRRSIVESDQRLGRLTASGGRVWIAQQSAPPDGRLLGLPTPLDPDATGGGRSIAVGEQIVDIEAVGTDSVVALTPTQAIVADEVEGRLIGTPIEPDRRGALVSQAGRAWVAQWSNMNPALPTTISFVPVRTDDPAPTDTAGTVPADSPPSTMLGNGAPTIAVQATEPLIDGESYAVMGAGLPPGSAVLAVCPINGQTRVERCWDPVNRTAGSTITIEEDGTFSLPWTADRSVYGDRWEDCGVVACTLGIVAARGDGEADVTTVLASTPLTFAPSGPVHRPSLRLATGDVIDTGTTVTVLGERFPPGLIINLAFCPTGSQSDACRYSPTALGWIVEADGTVEIPYTIPATVLGPNGEIDCTSARGACMLAVFGGDDSVETYAATLLDIGGAPPAGTGVPGTSSP